VTKYLQISVILIILFLPRCIACAPQGIELFGGVGVYTREDWEDYVVEAGSIASNIKQICPSINGEQLSVMLGLTMKNAARNGRSQTAWRAVLSERKMILTIRSVLMDRLSTPLRCHLFIAGDCQTPSFEGPWCESTRHALDTLYTQDMRQKQGKPTIRWSENLENPTSKTLTFELILPLTETEAKRAPTHMFLP
jgi:hypothetical protein